MFTNVDIIAISKSNLVWLSIFISKIVGSLLSPLSKPSIEYSLEHSLELVRTGLEPVLFSFI